MRNSMIFLSAVALLVGCSESRSGAAPDAAVDGETGDSPSEGGDDGNQDPGEDGASTNDSEASGGDDDQNGNQDGGTTAGSSDADGTDSTGSTTDFGFGDDPSNVVCDPCACNDGEDNDGDGQTDGFDTECTGAGDDDEGSFGTGISGDNRDPKWQDCFYDGDSGGGNDGCRYATGCLTGELDDDHPSCEVTQKCIDYCRPRTPNGCDCFGCCTFTLADGAERSVLLQAACEIEDLDACTSCIPSTGECSNECGRCELCPGKTIDDLPADCGQDTPPNDPPDGDPGQDPPPPTPVCEGGQDMCTETRECPAGRYCYFGCCIAGVT